MGTKTVLEPSVSAGSHNFSKLLQQYGCGPVQFEGTDNALYERHLLFDNAIEWTRQRHAIGLRPSPDSVRDILSQRWVLTEKTYERQESETPLLPLDGVPHRSIAGQQCHQSSARSSG